MKVTSDNGIERELSEFFTFKVPGHRFNPKFRAGIWSGDIRLYSYKNKTLYRGLLPYVASFCGERGYRFISDLDEVDPDFSTEDCEAFLRDLNLPFEVRDYQKEAIAHCIREHRTTLVSPTASGKSLLLYALIRWFDVKTLLIVPTTALVHQMFSDFQDYAKNDDWNVELRCSKVMGGLSKTGLNQVVISTWQSVHRLENDWLDEYEMVIVDECHGAKATSLRKILEACPHVPYRFGTTGTLDGIEVHQLVLEGLLGKAKQVAETKALIEQEYLASLRIKCLMLKYSDEEKKYLARKDNRDYQTEVKFLTTHEKRSKYIADLALKLKGNSLILFNYVDHGKDLYAKILSENPHRKVSLIYGDVDSKVREEIRKQTEMEDNSIIVASYGTYSTGINIVNLQNIVFASPSKSKIRNLQSIGRGLRRSQQKTKCTLFDISDDLSWKRRKNHTFKHFEYRLKLYTVEGFPVQFYKVALDG